MSPIVLLVIILVAHVPFFIYHRINFIHIHSSHDIILHRPSLTRPLGFHLFLIRIILVFFTTNDIINVSSIYPTPHLFYHPRFKGFTQ